MDEPAAKQSDPTVLDLHLRAITKETTAKPVVCTYVYVCVRCGNVYAYKVRTKYVKVHSLNSVALLATMYIFAIHVRTYVPTYVSCNIHTYVHRYSSNGCNKGHI